MTRFVNFLLYQIGWFACVLGVAWDSQWLGMCIALCLIGMHFWLAADRPIQIKLAFIAAAIGLVVDSTQLWAGVFTFPRGVVLEWLPPPFMTVLWMQFATTFRYCMRWLSGRYTLSACFGFVGAPLAFFAGERLGAIDLLSPRLMHFVVLGLLWSFSVPLLVYISDHLAYRCDASSYYRWPASAAPEIAAKHHSVDRLSESPSAVARQMTEQAFRHDDST